MKDKAFLAVVADDVREVSGCMQLCAGLEAGCEGDVTAMAIIFEDDNTEAAMLVDATNAFSLLNSQATLIAFTPLNHPLPLLPICIEEVENVHLRAGFKVKRKKE